MQDERHPGGAIYSEKAGETAQLSLKSREEENTRQVCTQARCPWSSHQGLGGFHDADYSRNFTMGSKQRWLSLRVLGLGN